MKIVLASINQDWESKKCNISRCIEVARWGSSHGADLIVFPEMTLTGYSMNVAKNVEDLCSSLTLATFKNIAQEFKLGLIYGAVHRVSDKIYNDAVYVDKTGGVLGRYSKIHLFSHAGEGVVINPGDKLSVIKSEGLTFGLSICYDLRFPELYSGLGKMCDVIINIASWPTKRILHWDTLLRARAIENQLFMVGVNRTGFDINGNEFTKSSIAYGPDGKKVEELKSSGVNSLIYIDRGKIIVERGKMYTRVDRKTEIYHNII